NEYMYEYYFEKNELNLSKNIIHLFENREFMEESVAILKEALRTGDSTQSIYRIELPLSVENKVIFKSVSSLIHNSKGKVHSVIGKLIDVSEEEAERQELIKKSETDGLTGLYNADTTKKLISEIMEKNDPDKADALLILDCDKFKEINDAHGHLHGDSVIAHVSQALKATFRKSDIIGRIGGDEFCIYMENVASGEFIISKYRQLVESLKQISPDSYITVSVGAALSDGEKSYDELFEKADAALYIVKNKGGDNLHFYDKKMM
ncbi:MAG: GGDEF domain-containing protein, partial [Clostridiaceae bacterium]|nr:GGDEF domain-containing protein [Clostridiaceae bacterium]